MLYFAAPPYAFRFAMLFFEDATLFHASAYVGRRDAATLMPADYIIVSYLSSRLH